MRMRSRRGANTIEFALIMPVLFALVTGTMDYAYLFALRFAAISAAQEGAREGSVTASTASPETAAADAALTRWQGFGLPATPTIVTFRSGSPELMVVRIEVDPQALVGLVPVASTFEITRIRRMEDQ
jgi:Flp pilus assembly protein TadG